MTMNIKPLLLLLLLSSGIVASALDACLCELKAAKRRKAHSAIP
jgi:hypothetical protein